VYFHLSKLQNSPAKVYSVLPLAASIILPKKTAASPSTSHPKREGAVLHYKSRLDNLPFQLMDLSEQ
jgi:hypothetical protein